MSDFKPLTGGCLCGAVRYTLTAAVRRVVNCHCTRCRRISGAAFQTVFLVHTGNFHLDRGADQLTSYGVSPQTQKNFCCICGSAIYNKLERLPKHVLLPIGSLDDPNAVAPEINIHCENMLPWVLDIMALMNFPRSAEEG
jgi:hypothetical protein